MKLLVSFVALACLNSVACSAKVKNVTPPPVSFLTPTPADQNPARKVIVLDEYVDSGMKDLRADEGKFLYERGYTFETTEELKLQIKKDFSNGNCGKPNFAAFAITKEDGTDMGAVIFPKEKEYNGKNVEVFEAAVPAGKYNLDQVVEFDEACAMYYHDFQLMKAE